MTYEEIKRNMPDEYEYVANLQSLALSLFVSLMDMFFLANWKLVSDKEGVHGGICEGA